jgi:hypothetical protein
VERNFWGAALGRSIWIPILTVAAVPYFSFQIQSLFILGIFRQPLLYPLLYQKFEIQLWIRRCFEYHIGVRRFNRDAGMGSNSRQNKE